MKSTWRPRILDENDARDASFLAELRSDPKTNFLDERDTQRRGLKALRPAPGSELLDETDRWIHYPWRNTVVALLGPQSFRTLRTDRNRNKITLDEQERLNRQTIGVVGLSVGHAVAHTLALEGICGELRLADFDEIELSNLNRIPGSVLDLGVNKAIVAARRIAEIDPYMRVTIFTEGITDATIDSFFDGLDIVIEECDSLDVKVKTRDAARRRRIPVLMETSDRGLLDVERFDLEPQRALFHGVLGDVEPQALAGLTTRDKIPIVLDQLDASLLSARMAASMVEVGRTIETWPQLGGDVQLGGATIAAAVRRLGTGRELPSGRIRVDLDTHLDELTSPPIPAPRAPAEERPEVHRTDDVVLEAIRRAPSGGNSQPWSVDRVDDVVTIKVDPDLTSTLDIELRGSHVAVGAAVFNARVAAAKDGKSAKVDVRPGEVRIQLGEDAGDPEVIDLFDAMMARNTNRMFGSGAAGLSEAERRTLDDAARGEGGRLVLLSTPSEIACAAKILAVSDRTRYLTPKLHREMMSELSWPGDPFPDTGIDVHSLGMDAADMSKLDIIRRSDVMKMLKEWDEGHALGEDTLDRVRSSSAVAIVLVSGSNPEDYIRGGSATQRTWIAAETMGLAVQPISPTFVYARSEFELRTLSPDFSDALSNLQRRFVDLVGVAETESIALVLRLSRAPKQSIRSRRRPLS